MLTSQIQTRVAKLSGSKIPPYSIYQALRTLVKRRRLLARRQGREYSYKFLRAATPAPAKPVGRPKRSTLPAPPKAAAPKPAPAVVPAVAPPAAPAPMVPMVAPVLPEASPAAMSASPAPLHKLAPGEVALLHIGDAHVETATNVHGRIVIERHRRPKK